MKTIMIITAVVTGLLIFSTVICGLWIKFSPDVPDVASSTQFHMVIGLLTALFSVISIVVGFVAVNRIG